MRRLTILLAVVVLAAAAGCGDGDDRSSAQKAPGVEDAVASPVRLQASYEFGGRSRHVDTAIAPIGVLQDYRPALASAVPDQRYVGVQFAYVQHTDDPFPLTWASFVGIDDRGAELSGGSIAGPARRRSPDQATRDQPIWQVIAFAVPRGRQLAGVRMRSIVKLWPFRASWRLPSSKTG